MINHAVIHRSELEELIAAGTTLIRSDDDTFDGLIPGEYQKWQGFFGRPWQQFLLDSDITGPDLRDLYFSFCLRLRYDFERRLDRCLYEPLTKPKFEGVWKKYCELCKAAVEGIESSEWKHFVQSNSSEAVRVDILRAVKNIRARWDIAEKLSTGATSFPGFGHLKRWGQLVPDGQANRQGPGHTWRLFVWVFQVVAMKMQLASNELDHELEPWAPAADRHAKSLKRSKLAIEGWIGFLQRYVERGVEAPAFHPILLTLGSTAEHLASVIRTLESAESPRISEGCDGWGKVISPLVADINLVCAAVLDELFLRDCFAKMHSLVRGSLSVQVYCYRGRSLRDPIVAQCLNHDLVAAGKSVEDAVTRLAKLLERVLAHLRRHPDNHLPVAPANFLRRFKTLEKDPHSMEIGGVQFYIRGDEEVMLASSEQTLIPHSQL